MGQGGRIPRGGGHPLRSEEEGEGRYWVGEWGQH